MSELRDMFIKMTDMDLPQGVALSVHLDKNTRDVVVRDNAMSCILMTDTLDNLLKLSDEELQTKLRDAINDSRKETR